MHILNTPKMKSNYIKHYRIDEIIPEVLVQHSELCQFEAGETILIANEPMPYFYFFVKGKLKIYQIHANGRALLIQFYDQFDTLGEVELMNKMNGSCSVAAVQQTHMLRISANLMREHAMDYPPFLRYVIRSLSTKLLISGNHHSYNLLNPVKNRLASYIRAYADASSRIHLLDSFQEISEYLGTTYRQMHRAFSQLQSEGIIKKTHKEIIILNKDKLNDLAGEIYQGLYTP